MKKILLLLIITTLSVSAQESVLLRLNYAKGDYYAVNIDIKQNMGTQGSVNTKMMMETSITDKTEQNIKTSSQIKTIFMDMDQGGMKMTFDSNKKEEDLDETGKMLKTQFTPMMQASINNTFDKLGNNLETKIVPAIPGMEQMTNSANSISFPEEKVSVGSSWTSKVDNQGITMSTTYTVAKIANGMVTLDVTGDVTGLGSGTVKGQITIDVASGVANTSILDITLTAQGINMEMNTKVTMEKIIKL